MARSQFGKNEILGSFPLGFFKQYIFTKKVTTPLISINQLQDLNVGGIFGDEEQPWYKNFTNYGVVFEFVRHNEQNISKLNKGRIDAFISFLPDISQYTDQLSYSPDHPLLIAYDRITSYNTPEAHKFMTRISNALKEMKLDGTTKIILDNYYLEFDETLNFD